MLTLTIRHWRGCPLGALRKGIVRAFGALQRHRKFKALLATLGGKVFVRALEVTHGRNGWHPHYHVLVLFDAELSAVRAGTLNPIEGTVARLWRTCVVGKMGAPHRPTRGTGAKLTACYRASYLTKLGLEVTDAGQSKEGKQEGRTARQLTSDWIANGRNAADRDAVLIREFIAGMHGAVFVAWPRRGALTRKNVEVLCPRERAPLREAAVMYPEEWDGLRGREVDGRDARAALLRAAEGASPGEVQATVEDFLDDILRGSRGRRTTEPDA
jgi:hypothetical protein